MTDYRGSIAYGKEEIPFDVFYAERKTLEIAVHPDARVVVKAPRETASEAITSRVKKRARWVRKQIHYFRRFEPRTPARQYVGGETHMFLGRQYRLKLRKHRENDVKLKGPYFHVSLLTPDNAEEVKYLLDDWYKKHARLIFTRRLEQMYEAVKKMKVPFPKIQLRKMIRRWGSCGESGRILLNTELIKAPLSCIDYVIMHELCHLRFHTHNNSYYKFLSEYMPDWEKRKERLETVLL